MISSRPSTGALTRRRAAGSPKDKKVMDCADEELALIGPSVVCKHAATVPCARSPASRRHVDGRVAHTGIARRVDSLSSIMGMVALHPDVL